MNGIICEIEKFAIHDGPGIRTVVFFKGCPLRCLWCSNPETLKMNPQVYYNMNKCISCFSCINVCDDNSIEKNGDKITINRDKCISCDKCIDICPVGALSKVGKDITVDKLFEEIIKDEAYFRNSGGGVTLSGGEVLLQSEFAAEFLKKCKEEYIHTAIETSGYADIDIIKKVIRYTDFIMYDIKHTDDDTHKKLTGVSNKKIIDNLKKISELNKKIVIRIPLIHGLNDSDTNIRNTCLIAELCGIQEIHILPYHEMGKEKYRQLEKKYSLGGDNRNSDKNLSRVKNIIESYNIKCVVGG